MEGGAFFCGTEGDFNVDLLVLGVVASKVDVQRRTVGLDTIFELPFCSSTIDGHIFDVKEAKNGVSLVSLDHHSTGQTSCHSRDCRAWGRLYDFGILITQIYANEDQ